MLPLYSDVTATARSFAGTPPQVQPIGLVDDAVRHGTDIALSPRSSPDLPARRSGLRHRFIAARYPPQRAGPARIGVF